jgi:hypothetical protein
LPLIAASLVTASACGLSASSNGSEDPLSDPRFKAAVEEVQQAGLIPYWLGEGFAVGDTPFELTSDAKILSPRGRSPGLFIAYVGSVETGTVPLYINSHSEPGGEADFYRDQAAALPTTRPQRVQVGAWQGELYERSSGPRPVNQVWLFVDVGDTVVIGQAAAVRNGIPGQDPNPLIDKDLLISVMAEHLRPYPE